MCVLRFIPQHPHLHFKTTQLVRHTFQSEIKMKELLWYLVLSLWIQYCSAIGMTIQPTITGDRKKYSSINNLMNCLGYRTHKDDMIRVTIKSGDKIPSQQLNLNVFDSENNMLRSSLDISDELVFIFTNLNNPIQIEDESSNILDRFSQKKPRDGINDLIDPLTGKSYVYICFDNIYHDKSWSYKKRARDVEMRVEIRNMTSFKNTDYNNYAKYFNLKSDQEVDANNEYKQDFSETDFEAAIQNLKTLLNDVKEELKSTESVFGTLMEHESRLRDVNESIFSDYTRISVVLIACICMSCFFQLLYCKYYFKRRKII